MGQFRDHIRGSRGNEDNIRCLRKGNMFNGKFKVPVKCIHQAFISGQCLECNRIDEICRIPGHKHMDICLQFFQCAGEICDFICSDTAAHA